jgi:hypothetical protein
LQPTLFKQAFELGATPISAFTDKVTHLIASDHGGAKYMVRRTAQGQYNLQYPVTLLFSVH